MANATRRLLGIVTYVSLSSASLLACGGSDFSTKDRSTSENPPSNTGIPGDGLVYWFRSDKGIEDDRGVASWRDQSGNEVVARQPDMLQRPTVIVSDSTPLPILQFDGEDDKLLLPDLYADFSNGLSFFAVAGASAENQCTGVLELSNGPEIDDIDFGRQSQSIAYEVAETYTAGESGAFPMGELVLLGVVHPPGDSPTVAELRINGTLSATTPIGLPNATERSQNVIGSTLYAACTPFAGAIGEILLYDRALEAAERKQVEAELRSRWSCCGD